MSTLPPPHYRFGAFEVDLERQLLLREGSPVPLKPKVFDLLRILVTNAGRLVTKRELFDALWPDQFVEESNLTQSIYELRKALGDEAGERRLVVNVPRRGYRFDAKVVTARLEDPGRARRTIDTIAVLPFSPLSSSAPDPSLELGIAETLITGLSRLERLMVRPIGSVGRYAGTVPDEVAAGRELHVGAVLSGSTQRSGDRLRVSARLIRVHDESVLWAETFDEPFTDIFSVQDAICDRVIRALSLELPPGIERLVPRHTEDSEVQALFLECRYHWHKWTPQNWLRSIACGNRVLERDPSHAPTYSWIAASHTALAITGVVSPREAFPEARRLVERALQLDPSLSEAHEVKGAIELFHEWDWEAAGRSLERAMQLNPGNAGACDLRALLSIVTRQPERAVDEVLRAREIDPLSLLVNTDVGNVLYYARRFDEAIEQLRHTLSLDPWFAHARTGLGYALLQVGEHERAIEEIESAIAYAKRDRSTAADLAFALATAGRRPEAQAILDAMIERSRSSFVDPYSIALVQVGLADTDVAFSWLDRALEERSRELIYLRGNPVFDHLRGDPRFEQLTASVAI